jgi:hypothetical protein
VHYAPEGEPTGFLVQLQVHGSLIELGMYAEEEYASAAADLAQIWRATWLGGERFFVAAGHSFPMDPSR